ncbi:hypothetical protein [Providencia manganoxydans]|uniref:hypothetical protein n=1 Tax=Providencia manganoxydans TaxID=2923283 RepID=UPI0034E3FF45
MDELKQKHKRVRRLESGVYTIEPESIRARNDNLCQICAITSNCPIQIALNPHQTDAEVAIRSCARFVPSLTFRPPYLGLGFDYFNTLRVGTTWLDRLSVGKVIALVNPKGDILRFGKVAKVVSGDLDKMLRIHAKFNHLAMAGKNIKEVERVIRKSYGHFLTKESKLTAIYIEKVTREIVDDIDNSLGEPPVSIQDSNVVNLSWHRDKK